MLFFMKINIIPVPISNKKSVIDQISPHALFWIILDSYEFLFWKFHFI